MIKQIDITASARREIRSTPALLAAIEGVEVAEASGRGLLFRGASLPWYQGAPLLDHLENVHVASDRNLVDLRLPVQLVLRPNLDFRGFCGVVTGGIVKPGDRILTCVSEYSSNYISYLQVAKKTGAEIVVVPDDKHGQIDLAALERAIDKHTRLVSISHVPTQGGLVQPAEAVGKIVNDAGVLYLLDACQSVGMMPIDVKKIGCDFLSATGRKYMRGPRGTGFLYARTRSTSQIEPIFLDNHAARWTGDREYTVLGDAKRFENWERYFAGVIGLKVAADQANELGMEAVWARLRQLADGLRARLAKLGGVTLTDLGMVKGAIVTFAVKDADHTALKMALREQGINVSVSTQFSSRLDLQGRGLRDVMRASVHVYNTEDELDRFAAALDSLIRR